LFWSQQATDLNALYDQLITTGVAQEVRGHVTACEDESLTLAFLGGPQVTAGLRICRSIHTVPFHALCRELASATVVANDVIVHLRSGNRQVPL
jgi:hypothetical protein